MKHPANKLEQKDFLRGQKYLWKLPLLDAEKVCKLAGESNLSFAVVQSLLSRGFDTKEKIDSFLFTTFEKDVAHPKSLKDSDKAVERILTAIEKKEQILVFGDYDVDGITSTAMMIMCLLPLEAKINFFLPNRVKDGYGLSEKIVKRAAKNNYSVIITVDNGITSFKAAKEAVKNKIDLIITDHHQPRNELPEAFAIVNPSQVECNYPCKILAGVGVAFKVISLLYEKIKKPLPEKVYELLMLGTIADVVPLLDENRYWVRYGLSCVNKNESEALRVLKNNSGMDKPEIGSYDVAFNITPQINALGRMEDPRQGVQFLIGSDAENVQVVGNILWELNKARKEVEKGVLQDVEDAIRNGSIDLDNENIIMAGNQNWPSGVIGLVASRLVESYGKPTFLFHLSKDGMAKGSCRSISEFNIFQALESCSDLIDNFGGHAHAAGLSLRQGNVEELKKRLEKLIAEQLTPFDLQQKLVVDAKVLMEDVGKKLISDMQHLEPFGCQNKQPVFYIDNVVLVSAPQLLKGLHVKCKIFSDGVIKPIIFFNRPELFQKFIEWEDRPFSVATYVKENYWKERRSIELTGLDVMFQERESV